MNNNYLKRKPHQAAPQKGLMRKYHIQKVVKIQNPDFAPTARVSQVINNYDSHIEALVPVDKGAEYFVLRLDTGASDLEHVKACRIAINAYAEAIKLHMPQLWDDLVKRYPII